ncbi:hypothetical protein LTR37_007454 [Vermiconidia calcicola]|uniref:Uncharacterized protein n=1 Tax=Vermiconidia calcicola TaxID=1690605 RepID=A0ACC3NEZ2_9PEZI|nr:hypothetical protein LTR37_007454 [Vermiconidia calcicola]
MTLHAQNPNPNAFVRVMRRVYNPIGFKKGYNFVLWLIFAGALLGFGLARLQYLSIDGVYKQSASPGEWFYLRRTFYKVGLTLHLATCIPAAILGVFQFIPVIRYKALIFHRINGYVLLVLIVLTNVGALMIARWAFGGTMATQSYVGTLAIMTLGSAFISYYNIKRLQIDQHRAWMIRTWFYLGTIITLRLIMILSAMIISQFGNYYVAMSCEQIAQMGGDPSVYPNCVANPEGQTAVVANLPGATSVEEVAASLHTSFGMAGWLAIALHAVGVEIYLALTPVEGERLRRVSYERQLERGLSHPGSSGLTADRLGDAEKWMPPSKEGSEEKQTGAVMGFP